ncbi:Subunit of heteropentameric Replication factor C (RF-C) [Blastocladiella emersonii ATCC 22665]|nr:Subunit of heteropentameric Replication factor C (RF-C) [Blastocladiella emersonii ATCC 22665]
MAASFFMKAGKAKSAGSGDAKQAPAQQPWIEKYRPNSINDISSQGQVTQVLRRTIESKNLPHLLFYGPPGTGKTSTILALSKELFGPDLYRSRILELNASDERGIAVVREKVKNFAKTVVSTVPADSGYPVPPYKIIILDEADSMTPDAQAALRRVMENYSNVTRFCLICNYVTRIIEPLASRCAKFRFTALEAGEVSARLAHIAAAEGVQVDDEALDAMMRVSEGDMRKAIMLLQSASRLVGSSGAVTSAIVHDIAGVVPTATIRSLAALWHAKPAATYAAVSGAITNLVADGWSANQITHQLYALLLDDVELTSVQKAKMAAVFGRVDHCLVGGADETLQLMDLVLETCFIAATAPVGSAA